MRKEREKIKMVVVSCVHAKAPLAEVTSRHRPMTPLRQSGGTRTRCVRPTRAVSAGVHSVCRIRDGHVAAARAHRCSLASEVPCVDREVKHGSVGVGRYWRATHSRTVAQNSRQNKTATRLVRSATKAAVCEYKWKLPPRKGGSPT